MPVPLKEHEIYGFICKMKLKVKTLLACDPV